MKKSVIVIFFTFLLIILFYLPVYSAEDPQETTNRQRVEDETLAALKKSEAVEVQEKKITFNSGGLISSYYWAYINDDNSKDSDDLLRNITYQNLYLWFKSTVLQKHLIYLRLKNTYITRHDVSSEYTGEGDDYTGPVLDMGYANISLKEGCRLFLGRQYLTLGKGITYNKTHDGIQLKAYTNRFMFKTFFSRTKPHEDNLDYSIPGYDKYGYKNFYGLELAYIESLRIVPYFYFLLQDDHPDEEPEDTAQEYKYNSNYLGIGVSGETPSSLTNLDWWLEIIKEQGKSYTDAPSVNLEESNIDAWAGVIGCEYKKHLFLNPYLDLNPSLELEYAYGSGDKDRTSVTNTDGGNLNGGDKNFLYYGYYFAGYALNPKLSNIHIYRIGLSISPLKDNQTSEKISLGTKFYIYRKDKEAGGIYDTDATKVSKDIGKEINFYFYWNVTPKVTWGLRYGKFFTGHAYADATDDDSQYAYTNFTISF